MTLNTAKCENHVSQQEKVQPRFELAPTLYWLTLTYYGEGQLYQIIGSTYLLTCPGQPTVTQWCLRQETFYRNVNTSVLTKL